MATKKPTTKMVSMKRTPEDKRGDKMEAVSMGAMAPDYPYGLCIRLDKEELDKLGMKQLPAVGTEMPLEVNVKVTRVSQSAAEGADDQTNVELQITDIGIDVDQDEA